MKFKIFFAAKNDIGNLIDIYSEWSKFKGILPDPLIEKTTRKDLEKYFDSKNSNRKYLIAKTDDGEPCGSCYVDVSFLELGAIRLGDMMIKETFRNKKIGSALIEETIKYAKANKVKKIWLWTQKELKPAIKFYKKNGFKLEGKQKNQFCNKDALLFGLVLK